MSTPSTALEGIAARPAPGHALKIVPARHPLQVFGTVLALALILIGLLELAGASRGPLIALAATFVVARVLHAIAFGSPAGPPTATRSLGVVGTMGVLAVGAGWLAVVAV